MDCDPRANKTHTQTHTGQHQLKLKHIQLQEEAGLREREMARLLAEKAALAAAAAPERARLVAEHAHVLAKLHELRGPEPVRVAWALRGWGGW